MMADSWAPAIAVMGFVVVIREDIAMLEMYRDYNDMSTSTSSHVISVYSFCIKDLSSLNDSLGN